MTRTRAPKRATSPCTRNAVPAAAPITAPSTTLGTTSATTTTSASSTEAAGSRRSLLRPLGIVGYDAIEPAILAALATEEPLLLVSEHGAAKTLLLVRIAESLGLELRHYNASILQFDDLAGFPIPDANGSIRYAAPPGAIWEAEVAFFDEIGRCRPDLANKLFPIIHERRIQGVPIPRLRYRWAATNPPGEAQDDAARFAYDGVEVLDPALADRFSWIVTLPNYDDLNDADRRAIISGIGERPTSGADVTVGELVETTRALIVGVRELNGDALASYVDVLIARLATAKITIGGRRAATLLRNMVAMRAAHLALGLAGDARACQAALLSSIPDVVRRRVSRTALLAAHEAAWRETALDDADPRRALLAVRNPMRRVLLALSLPGLASIVRGEAVCTGLADLPPTERYAVAWFVLPHLMAGTMVPVTTTETVAGLVADIAFDGVAVNGYGPHRTWAIEVRTALSRTSLPGRDAEYLHGVIAKHATPPGQLTGTVLTAPSALIDQLIALRSTCLAALGPIPAAA